MLEELNYFDVNGDLWIEVQSTGTLYTIPGIRLSNMCRSKDLGFGRGAAVTHMNLTAYIKQLISKPL